MVGDQFVAEEIVEDAMLFLWEKKEDLAHINSVKSYLYAMVRNASLKYLKKKDKTAMLEEVSDIPSVDADASIIEAEVHDVLIKALNTLPKKCKLIFELSCLEGLQYKHIAEDLNISVNTVKSQRARAIELLKDKLKDHPLVLFLLMDLIK